MLIVLACIGLSACQTTDKSKDNKEPVETEQGNDETKKETDSLPAESEEEVDETRDPEVVGDEMQDPEVEDDIVEDDITDESGADSPDYADNSGESDGEVEAN